MTKKTEYQKMYEDRMKQIEKIQEQIKLLEYIPFDLVKQAFPQGYWTNYWDSSFDFEAPMSYPLIAEFKEFCILQGWTVDSERQHVWDDSKAAGYFITVHVDEKHRWDRCFNVSFRSGKEGATCVLKEIGKKEMPVYEVVCTEGAKEEW